MTRNFSSTLTKPGEQLEKSKISVLKDTKMIGPKIMENFDYKDFRFKKIIENANPFQMAGDAVLNEAGVLVKSWPLKEVYDRPTMKQILDELER